MAELARYDLPLVAKYALNPASAGALGQMWFRFLEQYATRSTPNQPRMSTCWTCSLPCSVLAAVLRAHRPARDLDAGTRWRQYTAVP